MVLFRRSAAVIIAMAILLAGLFAPGQALAEKKYHIAKDIEVSPSIGGVWVFHDDVDAYMTYGVVADYYINEFWSIEAELLAYEFFMNAELTSDQKNFFRNYEIIPSAYITQLYASLGYTTAQQNLVADYVETVNRSAMPVPSREENISGYGVTIGPRFNFFPTEMGGLFLAMGLGAAMTDSEVPYSGNTSFFSFKTEIGQDLRITDSFSFLIRMGFRHLGGFDSKRLDGVGGSVGVGYTF